jgi:hypothetical protein
MLTAINAGGKTTLADNVTDIAGAVAAAQQADFVVLTASWVPRPHFSTPAALQPSMRAVVVVAVVVVVVGRSCWRGVLCLCRNAADGGGEGHDRCVCLTSLQ